LRENFLRLKMKMGLRIKKGGLGNLGKRESIFSERKVKKGKREREREREREKLN